MHIIRCIEWDALYEMHNMKCIEYDEFDAKFEMYKVKCIDWDSFNHRHRKRFIKLDVCNAKKGKQQTTDAENEMQWVNRMSCKERDRTN